uniref:Protein quiver n=1 Tax=Cacopsylla melanoneura TaxID=428564 RepID=A0A8D8WKL7_9HEMI
MAKVESLLFFGALTILLIAVQGSLAIRCWTCSSDRVPGCTDPMNVTYGVDLTNCDNERQHSPYLQSIAVCKKAKQRVNGNLVTVRSCAWPPPDNRGEGPCSESSNPSYIKMEFCETCSDKDGCNGGNTVTSTLIGLGVPALLVMSKYYF